VERLTEALSARLGDRVRTGAAVTDVRPRGDTWVVHAGRDELAADAVVLAVPAAAARSLLQSIAPAAAAGLGEIPAVSTGVVFLVYPAGTADALPEGTGFVVPRGRAPMTACTWVSNKWPSDAFANRAVVRCYVGAAGEEDILDADDADLIEACAQHLTALLSLPERPEDALVVRWPGAMPQYELGHVERVAAIRDALPAGIFVTGQAFDGTGIADCVRAAGDTAAAIGAALPSNARPEESVR
jgi:oxygen-dependent protoporphyrinogen oxidase